MFFLISKSKGFLMQKRRKGLQGRSKVRYLFKG